MKLFLDLYMYVTRNGPPETEGSEQNVPSL